MNPIIAALPGVRAVEEERAQVDERWRAYLEWKTDQAEKHARAVEEHKAALREAIDRQDDPPAAPGSPALEQEHARRLVQHQADGQRLDRAMYREIAAAGPVVAATARAQVSSAVERARPLLAELDAILREVRQGQAAVREVLIAQDLARGVRAVAGHGPEPADLDALADAVRHRRDLLHVRQEGGVLVDRGEDDGKHAPRPSGPRKPGMVVSNARPTADRSDFAPVDGRWQQIRH